MDDENLPPQLALGRRVGVGLLSAVSLHYTIYFAGSIAAGMWEKQRGTALVYGDSPLWLVLWFGLLLTVMWKGKPRLLDWAAPFALWVGFWFIGMVATNFHPDTAEQAEVAAFSLAMFLACFCIWGLTLLWALVRWGLKLAGVTTRGQTR